MQIASQLVLRFAWELLCRKRYQNSVNFQWRHARPWTFGTSSASQGRGRRRLWLEHGKGHGLVREAAAFPAPRPQGCRQDDRRDAPPAEEGEGSRGHPEGTGLPPQQPPPPATLLALADEPVPGRQVPQDFPSSVVRFCIGPQGLVRPDARAFRRAEARRARTPRGDAARRGVVF